LNRLISVVLAAMAAGCAHTAATRASGPEPVEAQPAGAAPMSPEASALFARAQSPDTVGSMILDLDELRARGFIGPSDPARSAYVDLLVSGLTAASHVLKDNDSAPTLARAAVLLTLLRDWDAWPHVKRVAVMVPYVKNDKAAEALMMVFAVTGDAATNATLIKGLAAADRASGKPLFQYQNGRLCYAMGGDVQAQVGPLCLTPGPGYLLIAASSTLDEFPRRFGTATTPLLPPSFLSIYANLPTVGSGDIVLDWKAGVHFALNLHTGKPDMATKIESELQGMLKKTDDRHEQTRALFTPIVEATKRGLAADKDAPPALQQVASRLTVDTVLDPQGDYQAFRQSIKMAHTGGDVSVEATVQEITVKRLLKAEFGLVAATVVGLVAAVAVPNLTPSHADAPNLTSNHADAPKSEVVANLKALHTAEQAFEQEKGHYGKTFAEIGFQPERGTRYSYCLAGKCLPCTAKGCYMPPAKKNPCLEMTKDYASDDGSDGFLACAFGDPEGKRDPAALDVWTIDKNGVPDHVSETGD
jgi:hypothetical protein